MKLYTFCICHLVEIIAERRRHWGEYCKGKSKTLFKRAVRLIVIEFRSILWSHKNALLQEKKWRSVQGYHTHKDNGVKLAFFGV